jgi:SAM-dependent methyltransferase
MMFGTAEPFRYASCADCGTVSLLDTVADLASYYRADTYYSFNEHGDEQPRPPGLLKVAAVSVLLRVRLPRTLYGRAQRLAVARWFRGLGVRRSSPILDVGTGSGRLLRLMASVGFTNLHGVDPFAPSTRRYPDGVSLVRGELEEVTGRFKMVMFHHSLEHVRDPADTLMLARRLLAEDGWCLVRVPIADSWAYRHYGADWVQMDAPRHRFLPTRRAVGRLAERAGFTVHDSFCDSDAFQIWGSEQYRRGIPLHPVDDEDRRMRDRMGCKTAEFGEGELLEFRRRAAHLNAVGEGDQACFVLRPTRLHR